MMKWNFLIYLLSVIFIPLSLLAERNLIIIVNKENPIKAISKEKLNDYYLGHLLFWDDNTSVKTALLQGLNDQNLFSKLIKMNLMEFKKYWIKQALMGSGSPPKNFNSEEAMIEYIRQNKGAIGILNTANQLETVKKIDIEP